MRQIQGKLVLLRVSGEFELGRVRVIGVTVLHLWLVFIMFMIGMYCISGCYSRAFDRRVIMQGRKFKFQKTFLKMLKTQLSTRGVKEDVRTLGFESHIDCEQSPLFL